MLAPFADVCYFADGRWWEWHDKGIARPTLGLTAEQVRQRFQEFQGVKVSIQGNENFKVMDRSVFILRNADGAGGEWDVLCNEPNGLATGRNSGFQSINLAWLAGAARILLLGYDMKGSAQRMHWFGDHPVMTSPGVLSIFIDGFNKLAKRKPAGLEIINCSADTALACFPRASIESVLPDPAAALVSA